MKFGTETKNDVAPIDPYAEITEDQLFKDVPSDGRFRLQPISALEPSVSSLEPSSFSSSARRRHRTPLSYKFLATFTGIWYDHKTTSHVLDYLQCVGFMVMLEYATDLPDFSDKQVKSVLVFGNADTLNAFKEDLSKAIQVAPSVRL